MRLPVKRGIDSRSCRCPRGSRGWCRSRATGLRSCCWKTSSRRTSRNCFQARPSARPRSFDSRATPNSNWTMKADARIWSLSNGNCGDVVGATWSGWRSKRRRPRAGRPAHRATGSHERGRLCGPRAVGSQGAPGIDRPAGIRRAAVSRPATREPLAGETQTDLFALLDRRDVLLHHPYDSYDPVVALISQAADDPDVLAIKQTLYRTSMGSPIIASLQRAAERNKQVTVLVEVTARFDEERNIQWARALEEAGAHVIYGVRGYKTHAKVCLIVRRGPNGLRRYVHLGTGNYNERTARVYTDLGLMTSSAAIVEDATAVFSALTGYSDPPKLKKLVMAPTDLRRRFLRLIDRERRRAESGQAAEIVAKMNSLIDEQIIEALYAASRRRHRPVQRPWHLCPAPRRAGRQCQHRGDLDRGSIPRTLAHLLLPQRRQRAGLLLERRLDDTQPRQTQSSSCSRSRMPRPARGSSMRCERCFETTPRRGAWGRTALHPCATGCRGGAVPRAGTPSGRGARPRHASARPRGGHLRARARRASSG